MKEKKKQLSSVALAVLLGVSCMAISSVYAEEPSSNPALQEGGILTLSEPLSESESETQSETAKESETQAETSAESETQAETEKESETQSETLAESETQAETEKESETEFQSEYLTESGNLTLESATESEPVSESESPADNSLILTESESAQKAELLADNEVDIDTTFPDSELAGIIKTKFDDNKDGKLSDTEIQNAKTLNVYNNASIQSLSGIEVLTYLTDLNFGSTNVASVDVSKNKALEKLQCYGSKISALNLTNNSNLKKLDCGQTDITSLNLSNNKKLEELLCWWTKITSLDVSNNTQLKKLVLRGTDVETLNLKNNSFLERLECQECLNLTGLDLSQNSRLTHISCNNTKVDTLQVSHMSNLQYLYCNDTNITGLDVSNCSNLKYLYCYNTPLAYLNLGNSNCYLLAFNFKAVNVTELTDPETLSLDLALTFPGITPENISNITNAGLQGSIFTVPSIDTSVTYTYSCGTNKGTSVSIKVTLNINADKARNEWIVPPSIADWTYGGEKSDPSAEPKFGSPVFSYSSEENGTYVSDVPTDAGTWYLKTTVAGAAAYEGLETVRSFVINQAVNEWQTAPSITGWTYGNAANLPTAKPKFGNSVIFSYSNQKDGVFTPEAPSNAGTWYLKAFVSGSANYSALEQTVEFSVSQAANTWTEPLSIESWTSGQYDQEKNAPSASAKFGEVTFSYSREQNGAYSSAVPEDAGVWYVKATVAETQNYTGLTAVQKFKIRESAEPETADETDDENDTNAEIPVNGSSVQTGDPTNIGLWFTLSLLSFMGIIGILTTSRRKRNR